MRSSAAAICPSRSSWRWPSAACSACCCRVRSTAPQPPAAYVPVVEEVAKHDASVAWCVGQACGCTMTAAYLAPEVAREIFGGERGIVAWGPPGPTEARMTPGGYRLTGTWSFASGSHHATWLGAHVAVFTEDGTPRLRSDGSPTSAPCCSQSRRRR